VPSNWQMIDVSCPFFQTKTHHVAPTSEWKPLDPWRCQIMPWSLDSLPGTIRKQRATIEKLTRENRKMKAGIEFRVTLLETNISPTKALLKMIFLFPRWDMLYSSLEGSRYFCPYTRPMMNQNRMLFGVKLPGGAQWNALWHWHAGCRKGWKWFEHHGLK